VQIPGSDLSFTSFLTSCLPEKLKGQMQLKTTSENKKAGMAQTAKYKALSSNSSTAKKKKRKKNNKKTYLS
jgi:hypothetical protein